MSGGSDRASAPDGFVLHAVVGRGASGTVWEATQESTSRRVALKILAVDLDDDEDRRRFDRERRAMAALASHPHVVTLFDAGVEDGRPWLALQLYRNGSYAHRLRQQGPLPVAEVVGVLAAVADALAIAHENDVVHCDVKPANIMVGDYGTPALGDFGVARIAVGGTRTAAGGYSLDHVAPELLDEDRPTPACDVYSLATTTWTLLCGHPPFRGADEFSSARIIRRILDEPLPAPTTADVPEELATLLSRMAAKDPADRPSMREVQRVVADLGSTAALPHEDERPDEASATPVQPDDDQLLTATQVRSRRSVVSDETRRSADDTLPDGASRANDTSTRAPRPERPRRRWVAAAVAVVLVVAALIGGSVLYLAQRGEALRLVDVDAVDGRAFAPDFTTGADRMPGLVLASSLPDGVSADAPVPGDTETLYRGERGTASCDRDGLSQYLAGRATLASVWTAALAGDATSGVGAGVDVPGYLAQLTPMLLRSDVRVTMHDNTSAGAAEAAPAVLRAGTAVLVDPRGVPRVRCRDGDPLTAPASGSGNPRTAGQAWPGFDPDAVVTVDPAAAPIRQFGLLELGAATAFRRPSATTGAADFTPTAATAVIDGTYLLTGEQTDCNLNNCEDSQSRSFVVTVTDCSTNTCRASEGGSSWEGTVDLVRKGDGWELSGPTDYGHVCGDADKESTFSLRLVAKDGVVRDTVWVATSVTGEATTSSSAGLDCGEGRQTWSLTGSTG